MQLRFSWSSVERRALIALLALAFLCAVMALWQIFQLQRMQRFNALLASQTPLSVDSIKGQYREPWLMVALANQLQREGKPDEALAMLREVEAKVQSSNHAADKELRNLAKFNSATIYLQQALDFANSGDKAKAVPPAELAKGLYREVLRTDATEWDARYNLERALIIVPELEAQDTDASMLPPPGERAITTMRGVSPGMP